MSAWRPANIESFPRYPRETTAEKQARKSASTGRLPDAGGRLSPVANPLTHYQALVTPGQPLESKISSRAGSDASQRSKAKSIASRASQDFSSQVSHTSRVSRGLSDASGANSTAGLPRMPAQRAIDRSATPSVQSGASSNTASGRAHYNLGNPLNRPTDHVPEVGNFTITALPGYTGWVPAKAAENVVGATYQRANELACVAAEARASLPLIGGRRVNPWGMGDRAGSMIVGYTGFIPGKSADGVFGHTYKMENEMSQLIKHQQATDKQARIRAYRDGKRPPTGHIDHSGYQAYGAGSGLDSTG